MNKNNKRKNITQIINEIKILLKNYLPNQSKSSTKNKKSTKKRASTNTFKNRALNKIQDIAPEELTGISSQNIGETQHSESPQAIPLVHIPLSNPSSNITGSNALSSLIAQQHYNKPVDLETFYNRGRTQITKPKPQLTKKEKYNSIVKIQEQLDNVDKQAITIGGSQGSMSNRRAKRTKS